MISQEAILHQQVCDYLRLQYPKALFRTDFAAGIKMTIGQATKHKRLQAGRAWPDLFVAETRGGYSGLFIELKAAGTKLVIKSDNFANKHIEEQASVLRELESRGYCAGFAVGLDEAICFIDEYFGTDA